MPSQPTLDLLVEKPQLHEENEAGNTQQHVGPHLQGERWRGGRETGRGGRGEGKRQAASK